MIGVGVYKYKNGQVYEGQFERGKRNGTGTLSLLVTGTHLVTTGPEPTTTTTTPSPENNSQQPKRRSSSIKSGSGSPLRKYYSGEWKNDLFHGMGKLYLADGSNYSGEFCEGLRKGSGTFSYANGDVYEGHWDNNMRNGKGLLKYGIYYSHAHLYL